MNYKRNTPSDPLVIMAKERTDDLVVKLMECFNLAHEDAVNNTSLSRAASWLVMMRALNAVDIGVRSQFNRVKGELCFLSEVLNVDESNIGEE